MNDTNRNGANINDTNINDREKQAYFDQYNDKTHFYGRIGLGIGILLLVAAPFLMGVSLDAMPNLSAVAKGFLQIALVYIPSCIVEFLIYLPMLGSGGSYVAFLTGNLINMKIPCAINARDLVGAKSGTPENEIVSTLSIATSSLVTTVVIAIGVLMLIPLQPVLESPVLQPAFNNVVPALFGAMAYRYFRKGRHIVAIPLVVMTVLFFCAPSLISSVGFLMILSGALAIAHAYIRFKKDKPL